MLRTGLLAAALLAAGMYAHRVIETRLEDPVPIEVCYERGAHHTIVRYLHDDETVFLLDREQTGSIEPPDDRIVTLSQNVMREYYPDGYLETVFERSDTGWVRRPARFYGAFYRGDMMVLENSDDREGYRLAAERYVSESEMLSRIESKVEDRPIVPLATCDPLGFLGRGHQ